MLFEPPFTYPDGPTAMINIDRRKCSFNHERSTLALVGPTVLAGRKKKAVGLYPYRVVTDQLCDRTLYA